MKNVTVKKSDAEKSESDLEEGEIHEFFIQSPDSDKNACIVKSEKGQLLRGTCPEDKLEFNQDRVNKSCSLNTQVSANSAQRNNSSNFQRRDERYGSPPSEGECVSEEDILSGNQVPHKDVYENNSGGRRSKNVYPSFQTTYGSVEDIMTKIGETLCRNSNCYYKERRSKGIRKSLSGRGRHDTIFRESSPAMKRLRTNYYKRRRRSESVSESDSDSWGKNIKVKHKSFLNARKKGKDVNNKKRKREFTETISNNWNYAEMSRQYKYRDTTEKDYDMYGTKLLKTKKPGVSPRLFKEIPLPQEQKSKVQESGGTDDSNTPVDSTLVSVNEGESGRIESSACSRDTYLANSDSRESSEQLSPATVDDDKDDDIELIKLRLLALTSNKKKDRISAEDPCDKLKDFKANEEKVFNERPKREVPDHGKVENDLSTVNDGKIKECPFDTDSDRYELYLRAEALKTALLKKHQHRIKSQRNSSNAHSSVSGDGSRKNTESCKTYGLHEVDELSSSPSSFHRAAKDDENDVETKEKNVTEVTPKISKNCLSDTKTNVEDALSDLSNNVECNLNSGHTETPKSGEASNEFFPPYQNSFNSDDPVPGVNPVTKNSSHGDENVKKKMKRTRLKKIKRLKVLNLMNESNIKENNRANERDEEDSRVKSQVSHDMHKKSSIKEAEKKFVLIDSLQKANSQATDSVISEKRPPTESKANCKGEDNVVVVGGSANVPQTVALPAPELERIIVHLGSDSSDEDYVREQRKKNEKNENILAKDSNGTVSNDFQNKVVHYEKSVELLLKEARRRIEKKSETPARVPATPEAVYNHLAPSQRLEYMRLKQKIAEREKLKKMKKNVSNEGASSALQGRNSNVSPDCKAIDNRGNSETKVDKSSCLILNKGLRLNDKVPSHQSASSIKPGFIVCNETKNSYQKVIFKKDNLNVSALGGKNSIRQRISPAVVCTGPVSGVNSRNDTNSRCNNVKTDLLDSSSKNSLKKGAAMNSVSIEKSILERKKMLTQNRLHLERLKILWKNIKIEKMIEEKYINEIKRLKLQQNFFELKINQQRLKIKKLAEESKQIYEAFQKKNKGMEMSGKKKKAPAKEKIAQKVPGSDEVERDNCQKDIQPIHVGEDVNVSTCEAKTADDCSAEKCESREAEFQKEVDNQSATHVQPGIGELKEYSSPLQILTAASDSVDCRRVDPNTIMCQYDLLGKCNDEECTYQHWRT